MQLLWIEVILLVYRKYPCVQLSADVSDPFQGLFSEQSSLLTVWLENTGVLTIYILIFQTNFSNPNYVITKVINYLMDKEIYADWHETN